MYIHAVKYEWDPDKNIRLKRERNVSFEQVVFHLLEGDLWKVAAHPNQAKYPGQRIYFVSIDGYIYLVPHVPHKDHVFLKTIIPSRKATKHFLEGGE